MPLEFSSRRSTAYGRKCCVASPQHAASSIGWDILKSGGNAAEACVAMAAALSVCEPCSNSVGGDAFALFYRAEDKKVEALMANGPSAAGMRTDVKTMEVSSGLAVTVPGSVAGWFDAVKRWGTGGIGMGKLLDGAIRLAEDGFVVGEICANIWAEEAEKLKGALGGKYFLPAGDAPKAGDIFVNKDLAGTLRLVKDEGKKGFYCGKVAEEIVRIVKEAGGSITLEDMRNYNVEFSKPIKTQYRGYNVYEVPPPTHGIAALVALKLAEGFDLEKRGDGYGSTEVMHIMIECMRLAYAEAAAHCADPSHAKDRCEELLDENFIKEQRKLVSSGRAMKDPCSGLSSSDTVQFCAVDQYGNACSFVQSNYMGFGTGLVPKGTGFTLQNRGLNFVLNNPSHPNSIGPSKKPYHTIIPGLVTREDGEFEAVFGVMGGYMQPQAHFQVLVAMLSFGMTPQQALDIYRFKISAGNEEKDIVHVEDGFPQSTIEGLRQKGHTIVGPVKSWDREMFGRGQIIRRNVQGILSAGSDGRADGCAIII